MCRRAALLALLLVALPSVTRALPTVHNFSLLSNWSASHDLPFATAYASVILHNGSLAISGGCVDVTCETITNRTIGYDPVAQVEYPLPELNFPIAGRHSTVSLSGSLVAVHMCGMVPYAFTPSHDVLNMVEVYNPGDASFSIISLTADQRRNITRANATCIGFKSFVYIFGGVDMKTSKFLDQMMALDMSVAGQITVYIHTLPDIGAYSLMTGYSDNFAMYLAGGVASLTDPLPQRSVFAIVPSGSSSNPLVGSCRTKMDSRIPFDASLTYLEPTEFQMVGYADWFVVKIGEFFATNINIKTCDAALCNSPNWTIISNPPTNYPESPYLPVAGTRRGASLVGIPLWQAGSNGPSTLSLWQFGGIAELNVTQFHTFPPTTLPPPTTTTTTVAPTTTTVAPPTTPAPNTTTSAPEPPKGVNQHLWDLMNVIWASDSTTEVPAAPGSNSGSGSEPGTPAATYATHWIETAVVGNLTHILTNLALPGLSVQDLNVPLGPVKPFNFSLTCPANETECDFYNSFCFAGQEGFDVCNVGLFSDPECYTSIKSHFLSGEEDVSMTLDNAGLGVRIWACFSYGTKSMSCGNQQPAYSVINFLDPLVTVSSQMTLAPPPTKAPASGQNYLLVAMAALAAVLLVALVGAVVWFKKRQRTAESAVAGRYINMEEIGRGAFGRVIKVKRISDDEVFAMKHIDCPSAEVLQEALKEFELLRKLQAHPNIIRVIDMFLNYEVVEGATGSHDGAFRRESNMRNSSSHTAVVVAPARHLCIVMDYHPSKDLKLWALGFATAIPECILCHIAVQTCSVLSFIHERNVIHRDLKPENILIVKDDRDQPGTRTSRVSQAALQPVVITDFGLAHFVAESRTVGFVGTAVYSAPECVALLLPNRQQLGLPPAAAAAAPSTQPRTVAYNDPAAPLLQSRNEPTLSYTAGINAPTPRSAAITRSGRAGSKGTGHTVSAQCDIWSLGCVLYAAATKRMERSNVRKMFEDVNSPTFVADITADLRNAGYSPAFAAFVLRLLKLEPEERPTAKDALKYFRKSNRDQSYHVTETQKLTAEERKRAKMPMAAPPAPSINRLSGSTTTPPSTRPSSKRAIDSPPTTASKAPPVPAQEGLVVPPPRAQYRTAEDTAAPPPAAPTREPSRLRENSVDRGSSPRVVVVGSPQGSKRAAPRSSSDGERESLRTRDTPRTPSPTVQAGTARGHNGVGATVVVSSGEEDKILAEYSDRDD